MVVHNLYGLLWQNAHGGVTLKRVVEYGYAPMVLFEVMCCRHPFFVAAFPPVDFFLVNWCGGVQWDPSAVVTTCFLWVHTDDKWQSMTQLLTSKEIVLVNSALDDFKARAH